jgi:aminomethyltransferase
MHARQQVARQIAGFRMAGQELPLAGAQVFDEREQQVGVVTSSTISPVLSNAAIGLAMLKRPSFNVGTKLRIGAEGAMREATVVATPFV